MQKNQENLWLIYGVNNMAKVIMVQGTMSNAGKSLIVAGLCRIFKQDGKKVAPFKSQNMALNSYITKDGMEMGRAQVMQAMAAGIEPSVLMNPILLKPTKETGSQVIVNGKVFKNMEAKDYFAYKTKLIPDIIAAFEKLAQDVDIIVIEGAGSPAEINLKENDIVNMGMAKLVDAPVLLVGDIDRGGVFAQLLGTLMLLEEEEKERVKGLIINKFRGDKTILDPGIQMLYEKGKVPITGVVPYMQLLLEDEDSLSTRFEKKAYGAINIGVIRFPRISNYTDFDVFEQFEGVALHYISDPSDVEKMDFIILPGSKNTIGDFRWMVESGMETAVKRFAKHSPVWGVCGGYQMLGEEIVDTNNVEEGGSIRGMGLVSMKTYLGEEKKTTQIEGSFLKVSGIFEKLSNKAFAGYEIHMGVSKIEEKVCKLVSDETGSCEGICVTLDQEGDKCNVYGSYVHGIFDKGDIAYTILSALADKKQLGKISKQMDRQSFLEKEYDKLADILRQHMDMDAVYEMLREAKIQWK